jgi:hypothetical protein
LGGGVCLSFVLFLFHHNALPLPSGQRGTTIKKK